MNGYSALSGAEMASKSFDGNRWIKRDRSKVASPIMINELAMRALVLGQINQHEGVLSFASN